jgi:sulfur-carrier protein
VTAVQVTVRYFAAARAAAGVESETLDVPAGTTVATLAAELSTRSDEMAGVLARCSFLCDEVAVRDMNLPFKNAATLDVLPPFAGG